MARFFCVWVEKISKFGFGWKENFWVCVYVCLLNVRILVFSLKENLDFFGKMLMIVQEKFMSLVGFVVIVCQIGWVCVRVLFYKKIYGFGW